MQPVGQAAAREAAARARRARHGFWGYQTEARACYNNSYRLIALSKSLATHINRASESYNAAMVAFGSKEKLALARSLLSSIRTRRSKKEDDAQIKLFIYFHNSILSTFIYRFCIHDAMCDGSVRVGE